MKRWTWVLLLAAAGPGCVTVPASEDEPLRAAPAEVEEAPRPLRVMPDQVTEENATDVLRQMEEDTDRQLNAPPRLRR
jgi:hypothetical protein